MSRKPPDDAVSIGVANWDGDRIAGERLLSLGQPRISIVAGDRYSAANAEMGATAVKRLLEIARTDRNELKSRS